MADDADDTGPTTDPLHELDAGPRTMPMPMAQSDDEIPTNPRRGVEEQVPFDAEITGPLAAAKPQLAAPDDDTGYIDPRGLGVPPEAATNKLPVPPQTVMTEIKDARPQVEDEDTTNIAGVSDDAIVRRVVLPDVDDPPTAERPRPNSRAAQVIAPTYEPPPTQQSQLIPKPHQSQLVPKPQQEPTQQSQLVPKPQQPPTRQSQLVPKPSHLHQQQQQQQQPLPQQPLPPKPQPLPQKPVPTSGLIHKWRASSGFWSNRPPTRGSTSSDAIDAADFAERQKRAYIVALVTCAVLLFALAVYTIVAWSPPGDVLVLGLLSVIPTTLIVGWLTRPTERDVYVEDAQMLIGPVGAALLAMLVLPLPWQVGYARLALRSLAGQSPAITAKVMRDRSDAVVIAECTRVIAAYPRVGVAELLAANLPGRPDVARACIASDAAVAPLVSGRLVEVWGSALTDKSTSAQKACDLAEAMTALQLPAGEVETRLRSCVKSAPPDARKCCGDALAAVKNGATPD